MQTRSVGEAVVQLGWPAVAFAALMSGTVKSFIDLLSTLATESMWSFWIFVVVSLGLVLLGGVTRRQTLTIQSLREERAKYLIDTASRSRKLVEERQQGGSP